MKITDKQSAWMWCKRLLLVQLVAVFLTIIVAPTASAITYHLPDLTSTGKAAGLAIGRLGTHDGKSNTLPVQATTVKLIYTNVPDSVQIFDGPFCRQSENSVVDNHTFNNACNDTNLNYRVHYDFQAVNNETGVAGPVKRVYGYQLAALTTTSVSLADLQGVSQSTDNKYFVQLTVSWARPNPATCTAASTTAQGCYGGTNVFGIIMPRTSDLATYPANNTDIPDVPALALLATGPSADEYSHLTFEFAPKCNASGAALRQKLAWEDADTNETNQRDWPLAWELREQTPAGVWSTVRTMSGAQNLGNQGEYRSVNITFKLNHKYRWIWRYVDKNNGVNLYIPYDGYDYVRTCPPITPPDPPDPPVDGNLTRPFFRVNGGDLSAGQGMSSGSTSCLLRPANTRASIIGWNRGSANSYAGAGTQQAAFARNHLQEFATAQTGSSGSLQPSGLSFANTAAAFTSGAPAAGIYGGSFAGNGCIADQFVDGPDTIPAGAGRLLSSLNRFPDDGNIPNGESFEYHVDGDLYIDRNVRFSGSYGSTNDIPTFKVVVKGNIYIDRNVRQLDGNYVARPTNDTSDNGDIYTCSNDNIVPYSAPALNGAMKSICNSDLTVNGSFSARRVWLLRTVGDVTTTPAETFNYVPDLWLSTKPSTVPQTGNYNSITGLPPVL